MPRERILHVHVCPVCSVRHAVNDARHSVSWGRALACSPECESLRRRLTRDALTGTAPRRCERS